MQNVVIDSFNVEVFRKLSQILNRFHSEHLLKYLLRSCEEDALVSVAKVQGFGQDPKELWLLETYAQPLINY